MNSYGGIGWVQQKWRDGGYTKPYLVTETGPAGSWEVPSDANGVPRQPDETATAQAYTDAWRAVTAAPGVALGATMFHYGVENDEPGVWLNLRTDGLKRPSWYAVQQAYRGTVAGNRPPVVGTTTASPSTGVAPGATVTVTAPVSDPDGDALTWRAYTSSRYIDGNGAQRETPVTRAADGTLRITAPTTRVRGRSPSTPSTGTATSASGRPRCGCAEVGDAPVRRPQDRGGYGRTGDR